MMSDAIPKTFLYLKPVTSTLEWLACCDLCDASEIDDIIAHECPSAGTLRPMFLDERDGCMICLRCAEAGDYLVIETCEAKGDIS